MVFPTSPNPSFARALPPPSEPLLLDPDPLLPPRLPLPPLPPPTLFDLHAAACGFATAPPAALLGRRRSQRPRGSPFVTAPAGTPGTLAVPPKGPQARVARANTYNGTEGVSRRRRVRAVYNRSGSGSTILNAVSNLRDGERREHNPDELFHFLAATPRKYRKPAQTPQASLTLFRLSWMPTSPRASRNALRGTAEPLSNVSQSVYAP